MKVTLDRNVFEKMLLGRASDAWTSEKVLDAFQHKKLRGFICASHFVWEHLPKSDQASAYSKLRHELNTVSETVHENGSFHATVSIGPDPKTILALPASQLNLIQSCKKYHFSFMYNLRLGIPHPVELNNEAPLSQDETFDDVMDRMEVQSEVLNFLSRFGAGEAKIDKFHSWLDNNAPKGTSHLPPLQKISLLNDDQKREFASALAERCDAEIIACHVGHKNDFLVTNDYAKGRNGFAFGPDCREAVSREFGVKFLAPEELEFLINEQN